MRTKLWVDIRGHAFATHWVEHFKHLQTTEASSKKSQKCRIDVAHILLAMNTLVTHIKT